MSQPSEQKPLGNKELYLFTQEGCPPCPAYDKMAKETAPKDVIVKEIKLGENPDLDMLVGSLGVKSTPSALYVGEHGVKLMAPTGKETEDRAAIANLDKLIEDENVGSTTAPAWGCSARYGNDETGWAVKLGSDCVDEVNKSKEVSGPGAKKNLAAHLTSDDPRVRELLKHLSDHKKEARKS